MNVPLYLSYRYFRAKKTRNAVNIIVFFSVFALSFSSAAMLILLSVFSGLQSMNIHFISDVNPEIKISPFQGKYLKNATQIENQLRAMPEVAALSKSIEEKVYLTYRERSEVATMKAVDSAFTKIYPLDTTIIAGNFLSNHYINELLLSNALAFRLNIPISETEYAEVYVPKAGQGRITTLEDNFTIKPAFTQGVFYINDNYNNTVFAPLAFAQNLLSLQDSMVGNLNLKLVNPEERIKLKESLQSLLGNEYKVETREDQDAAFLQMMNIERLMIYLLMTLITLITTFTLAGAVVVIILDKKLQTSALLSMGLSKDKIKQTYFLTGMIITFTGMIIGLVLGSLLVFLQKKYGLVKVNEMFAFPVEFNPINYILVIATLLVFGGLVSYITSRKIYY